MLAVAVHAADSSAPQEVGEPGLIAAGPGATSAGNGTVPAARSAAPASTGAQAFTGTAIPPGPVHRNVPLDMATPAASPPGAPAPLTQPGPDQDQPAGGTVERAVVPVTDQASRAPSAVVGGVTEAAAPTDEVLPRSETPVASFTQQAAPALQATMAPIQQLVAETGAVATPVEEGAQPAMAMLSPLALG